MLTLNEILALSSVQQGDGLDQIPRVPGVYAIVNRYTRRVYVGCGESIRGRCYSHLRAMKQALVPNGRMRRDLQLYGLEHFFSVALECGDALEANGGKSCLGAREYAWIVHLDAHREMTGYNLYLGSEFTKGAKLRDRERKLLRRCRGYTLLDGVDINDPIPDILLDHWVREPLVTKR